MEVINMSIMNSYKNIKKHNSLLPNISYNNTSQKEFDNQQINPKNNKSYINLNYSQFKNNIINKKEKVSNTNNILYTHNNIDNYTLRKYNSQIDLFNNNNYDIINHTQNNEDNFNDFFGKIKISNYHSSAEIILLIENILNSLNYKKNYTFTMKDSLITFSFGNANKAIEVFKKLNMEKLNNKYYRNLMVDINLDLKRNNKNIELPDKTKEDIKEENEIMTFKKISPIKKKLRKINNINRINNFKSYKTKDDIIDKNFEGIYKNYLEYFKKRKEKRRQKELSYVNGKNYSLQASSPYVENDNRNYFIESLRKYKGEDISPSKFNIYIDKASIK